MKKPGLCSGRVRTFLDLKRQVRLVLDEQTSNSFDERSQAAGEQLDDGACEVRKVLDHDKILSDSDAVGTLFCCRRLLVDNRPPLGLVTRAKQLTPPEYNVS